MYKTLPLDTRTIARVMTLLLWLPLGVLMLFSLRWRMEHDIPLLTYEAFLSNEHHLVMYRDIWEMSMPGTFLVHGVIGWLAGYSDLAYRVVDLVVLVGVLALTYRLLRPLGHWPATLAAVLWGLVYLNLGPTMGLQKDYTGLVFVLLGLNRLLARPESRLNALAFGVAIGLACWIKPPFVLWFGLGVWYRWRFQRAWLGRLVLYGAAGGAVVSAAFLAGLWWTGALPAWWQITTGYLPLYLQLDGQHQLVVDWSAKMRYYVVELLFGYAIPGFFIVVPTVLYLLIKRVHTPALPRLLVLAWALAWVYPAISGQFWRYHWIPFYYFSVLLVALLLEYTLRARSALALSCVLVFAGRQLVSIPNRLAANEAPKYGLVDELATYIRHHIPADATIQPLDWTGGAIHALLLERRPIATRFLYDFMFYHHVDDPLIQSQRTEFITLIAANPPAYFLEILDKPRVSGPGTSPEFPALTDFIGQRYVVEMETERYRIFRLQTGFRQD